MRTIWALGIGALAMYYLDPENGARRRALVRDKLVHFKTVARREVQGHAKDVMNRAEGVVAEAQGTLQGARERLL